MSDQLKQMTKTRIALCRDQQSMASISAQWISDISSESIRERGRFLVALSGGSALHIASSGLEEQELASSIDWAKWQVFYADERVVPLEHEDSNYHQSVTELLHRVSMPVSQIYPAIPRKDAQTTAVAYEQKMRQLWADFPKEQQRFDLVILGMGKDGHTASLFPEHPLLQVREHWVGSLENSPKPPQKRISLTLPMLCRARQVMFLVSGVEKAWATAQAINGFPSERIPASLIRPEEGVLSWVLDQEASALLAPGKS